MYKDCIRGYSFVVTKTMNSINLSPTKEQVTASKGGFFWSNNAPVRFHLINRPSPNFMTVTTHTGIVLYPIKTDLSVTKRAEAIPE